MKSTVPSSHSVPVREMKILSLGMTRTGSSSISEALTILGFQGVHHGVQAVSASPQEWALLSLAADSTFPSLPTYTGIPFTRAQWDETLGSYEAVTDVGSFFALPLINAYPEAKVILVERDIEAWYRSMDVIFDTTWGLRAFLILNVLGPMYGLTGGVTIKKIISGFYGSSNLNEIRKVARQRYREHYASVRAAVPKERLLEYKIEEGWGPLCGFLGKAVPDVAFPVKNKREEHLARSKAKQDRFFKIVAFQAVKKAIPWTFGLGTVLAAGWVSREILQQWFIGVDSIGEFVQRIKSLL